MSATTDTGMLALDGVSAGYGATVILEGISSR